MDADEQTKGEVMNLLRRWSSGFANRQPGEVTGVFSRDADTVFVTSEEAVLRGYAEIDAFLKAYATGLTTYEWTWHEYAVSSAGPLAWLLAEGVETARRGDDETQDGVPAHNDLRESKWAMERGCCPRFFTQSAIAEYAPSPGLVRLDPCRGCAASRH